jgi:hypothetical protein
MTTRATTWAAQIAVMLALVLTSTTSASSGFLAGNSCRGENSLEDGFHRGQASANAGTQWVCEECCRERAADCVVAPTRTPMEWKIPINEGGAVNAVGKAGNIEIEIIGQMSRSGKTITLDGVHFTKNAGGTLGRQQLEEFGRDFLRQHGNGATELVINGAPRTTGATAGTGVAPKPIIIKLE